MTNPYGQDLGTREPLVSLQETPERIRQLIERWGEEEFRRVQSADKWTAAQLLDHLAQTEMVFGVRVRMALITPGYVVQPFDQDQMMAREARRTGREAFEAYYAFRRWNLPLYRSLTPEERDRRFTHPERGEMSVGDLLALVAGHELHHAAQLEEIAAQPTNPPRRP